MPSKSSMSFFELGSCFLNISQFLISLFTPPPSSSSLFPSVPPSLLQPPLPLSLPVHMSVIPPSWQVLPLSQAELGPLFSNSSPFSFSQSLFMASPPGRAPTPGLQASFGPYSVTQVRRKVEYRWDLWVTWLRIVLYANTSLSLSTAHIGACPPSLSPAVCLPPLRACGEREGWGRAGEVQGEGSVPQAGWH